MYSYFQLLTRGPLGPHKLCHFLAYNFLFINKNTYYRKEHIYASQFKRYTGTHIFHGKKRKVNLCPIYGYRNKAKSPFKWPSPLCCAILLFVTPNQTCFLLLYFFTQIVIFQINLQLLHCSIIINKTTLFSKFK